MIQKQRPRQGDTLCDYREAAEIATRVAEIYVDLNEQKQVIKSRSSLPCTWFVARECFMTAYEVEYPELSEDQRNSYHHVYRELSFFVEDDLCKDFNAALNVAAKCRYESLRKLGSSMDEACCRHMIAYTAVTFHDRREIWAQLAWGCEETCPTRHLLLLAETLSYCSGLHTAMWDEWAAFANLIAYRRKMGTENGISNRLMLGDE